MESRCNSNHSLEKASYCSAIERKPSFFPSAIVIGSGFAGLVAAHALQKASFKVVLLESRDRIGGRAYTDYSFGFPIDMGTALLHGVCDENPLAPVIGRLGLPLYRTSGDNSLLFDHDLESYALFDTDGRQIPQELVTKVGEAFDDILKEADKLRQETINDVSIAEAIPMVLERRSDLRQEGLANKVLQWYLCRMEGWFAADADTISLKYWDDINYLVSHWGSDVNSLGSYSYDTVGKPHYLHEWLRIPVDNLFFAGEATCMDYTGTVHGAYNTGLKAAEECRMRVLENHGDLDNTTTEDESASVSVPLLISRM